MAGNENRKAELIAQLARARQQIDASGANVRRSLDVPARIRSNFQKNAVAWVGGGLAAGVLIAFVLRRPRSNPVRSAAKGESALPKAGAAGLLVAGGKIAFDLLRPMLIKWVMNQATPMVEKMMARYTGPTDLERDR